MSEIKWPEETREKIPCDICGVENYQDDMELIDGAHHCGDCRAEIGFSR